MATNFRGDSRLYSEQCIVGMVLISNIVSTELASATQELNGLEALEYEMSRNLETLKERQADAKFSRTIGGRIFNWGGRLFAIYCIFRILNVSDFSAGFNCYTHSGSVHRQSLVNLVVPAPPTTNPRQTSRSVDMLSIGLAKLLSLLSSVHLEEDGVAVISRQISLGLVGVIILSSIRLVLRGVARVRIPSTFLRSSHSRPITGTPRHKSKPWRLTHVAHPRTAHGTHRYHSRRQLTLNQFILRRASTSSRRSFSCALPSRRPRRDRTPHWTTSSRLSQSTNCLVRCLMARSFSPRVPAP